MSKLRGFRSLTRKDKRAIKVLQEGFRLHENLRFVTLTGVGDFQKNFRKLKYYLNSMMGNIQYFGVRTAEGVGGVVHLVYAGKSVRYGDLSAQWEKISGSWIVSISKVRDVYGMIKEMTRQRAVIRYFHSRNWDKKLPDYQIGIDGSVKKSVYREMKYRFIS